MRYNTTLKLIIRFLSVGSIIISICALLTPRFPGDLYLALRLQSIDSPFLLSLAQGIAFIFRGWYSALVVVVIGMFVWWRTGRREAVMILAAGLLNFVNAPLKLLIGRPRPSPDLIEVFAVESDKSFPSGHAFYAITIFGFLAYIIFVNLKKSILRTILLAAFTALILLIGVSRVYLGVHWPSDILGGYLIGGTFLILLIWFYRKQIDRRQLRR